MPFSKKTLVVAAAALVAAVSADAGKPVLDDVDMPDLDNVDALLSNPFYRVAIFDGDSSSNNASSASAVPNGIAYFTKSGGVGFSLNGLQDLDTVSGVSGCATGGLLYHIHDNWDNIPGTSATGGTACGKPNTANHYDPTIACGSASNNPACTGNGGCVDGSTAFGTQGYSCSPETFAENQFTCEVGDLSNKFGKAQVNGGGSSDFNWEPARPLQYFDALKGKSVVFHCNSGARAFCALIQ